MRLKPGTMLHRCADCPYWEPALTYFGEPTGQGGCRFAPARNRKGDKLRECANYASPPVVRTVEITHQEASMTDLREKIFHYVKDACFSHQACPLDATGEGYTYKDCRRWTCGHVLGATDKIVALIEGEGYVKLGKDEAILQNASMLKEALDEQAE